MHIDDYSVHRSALLYKGEEDRSALSADKCLVLIISVGVDGVALHPNPNPNPNVLGKGREGSVGSGNMIAVKIEVVGLFPPSGRDVGDHYDGRQGGGHGFISHPPVETLEFLLGVPRESSGVPQESLQSRRRTSMPHTSQSLIMIGE